MLQNRVLRVQQLLLISRLTAENKTLLTLTKSLPVIGGDMVLWESYKELMHSYVWEEQKVLEAGTDKTEVLLETTWWKYLVMRCGKETYSLKNRWFIILSIWRLSIILEWKYPSQDVKKIQSILDTGIIWSVLVWCAD